ncbi:DUF4258 domain-containing protein [Lysinibacillus sp. CTST325]
MKNNLIKSIIGLIFFTLVFSIISPSLAKASESQDLQINNSFDQEEALTDNEFDGETDGVNQNLDMPSDSSNDPRINLEDEFEIQPRIAPAIPLLAGIIIRSGVSFIARTSTGNVVRVSAHAAERAVERKITAKMIDQSLAKGTKYVDLLSGERVAWAENGNKVAVLLNKNSDVIETVYDTTSKKLKWFKNYWQYIGDIK